MRLSKKNGIRIPSHINIAGQQFSRNTKFVTLEDDVNGKLATGDRRPATGFVLLFN